VHYSLQLIDKKLTALPEYYNSHLHAVNTNLNSYLVASGRDFGKTYSSTWSQVSRLLNVLSGVSSTLRYRGQSCNYPCHLAGDATNVGPKMSPSDRYLPIMRSFTWVCMRHGHL
jgi:hypothetical protein